MFGDSFGCDDWGGEVSVIGIQWMLLNFYNEEDSFLR